MRDDISTAVEQARSGDGEAFAWLVERHPAPKALLVAAGQVEGGLEVRALPREPPRARSEGGSPTDGPACAHDSTALAP